MADPRRIVVKLGTNVVTGKTGSVVEERLAGLVGEIATLKERGKEVLLVSSGAVGLGKVLLNPSRTDLPVRQACAAVGQNLLMTEYQILFAKHGIQVAQVLVTSTDLADRQKYLNLRGMLGELLKLGVIPILNENDSVSTMELIEKGKEKVFGDNDRLSSLVASKVEADLLILLTDVEGVYDRNPKNHDGAKILREVRDLSELDAISREGTSAEGRGGMDSKLEAVRLASMSGVATIVASGFQKGVLHQTLEGASGTYIHPTGKVSARRKWIGFSSGVSGAVAINEGAQRALEESPASLLAVGVVSVSEPFKAGETISIEREGREVGRGISNYNSDDVEKLVGKKSSDIEKVLGRPGPEEIVHRDRLIIFNEREP